MDPIMMTTWTRWNTQIHDFLFSTQSVFLLAFRLWVAWVFFKSGLIKLQSWDVTVELFSYEYAVPLLPSLIAALMATSIELLLPPLLALGLMSRTVAFILFLFNIIAAISYPDMSAAGLKDHQLWGLVLLWVFLQGAGLFSLDKLIVHSSRLRK
jgi:putative oxidoreductase